MKTAVALVFLALAGVPAHAQSAFSAAAEVGNRIVTNYEVRQRIRLLEALGSSADPSGEALDVLIEERLKTIETDRAGLTVTANELQRGIEEFASRGDLNADQFIAQLGRAGVDAATFRDFIQVGLVWRKLIQQRYRARVTVTDAEVDRELGLSGQQGTLEVQFSEIFLPTNNDNNRAITEELTPQILALTRFAPFEDAARRFSVGPSRENGGRVERWVSVTNLPPKLREAVMDMSSGQVTGPIDFPNAIGLFQLRGIREGRVSRSGTGAIDFATYTVSGDTAEATRANAQAILDKTDTCDDLYGHAKGLDPSPLVRQEMPPSQIRSDISVALASLDAGEASLVGNVVDGQSVAIVMLCARLPAGGAATNQEELRSSIQRSLTNRKLESYSNALLQELRAETRIVRK